LGNGAGSEENKEREFMLNKRIQPDNPLAFIQRCVQQRKIFWTYHINMRLQKRGISRQMVLESLSCYEVIEEYPDDKYFPSYLIYTHYQGEHFHILFAVDVEGDNVRIITAYRPNPIEWTTDFKTRRESR
jgi:hypothetical protein